MIRSLPDSAIFIAVICTTLSLRVTNGLGNFPAMDLRQTESGIEVVAEVPGMSPEAFDLSLSPDGDVLIFKGQKEIEREENEDNINVFVD